MLNPSILAFIVASRSEYARSDVAETKVKVARYFPSESETHKTRVSGKAVRAARIIDHDSYDPLASYSAQLELGF